jgi:hypothetical protein
LTRQVGFETGRSQALVEETGTKAAVRSLGNTVPQAL